MNKGIVAGLSAFLLWGLLPIYWKNLVEIPSLEILCHRIGWSFLILLFIILLRKKPFWLSTFKKHPRQIPIYLLSSALISVNWFVYIWSVNSGFIVESSLGYFINPLVNVLLGVIFLKETLRRGQWFAVGIAVLGVLWLTLQYGKFPWIALTLAFSFGLYGLTRKLGELHSIDGLSVETTVLLLPISLFLIFHELQGQGSFLQGTWSTRTLLLGSGVVTAVPLLLFAKAVKLVPLSTVGIMQYLAPTLQLMVGVLVYKESFEGPRVQGFVIIWIALIIYTVESFLFYRKTIKVEASHA